MSLIIGDGVLKYLNFRFLGVVGHHEDSFPVEKMDVNTTGELVASISHDNR